MTIKNQGEKIAVSEQEPKQYEVQVAVTYYFVVEADNEEQAAEIASYDYQDYSFTAEIDSVDVAEIISDEEEDEDASTD
jgi:uncharacterized protein YwgA